MDGPKLGMATAAGYGHESEQWQEWDVEAEDQAGWEDWNGGLGPQTAETPTVSLPAAAAATKPEATGRAMEGTKAKTAASGDYSGVDLDSRMPMTWGIEGGDACWKRASS